MDQGGVSVGMTLNDAPKGAMTYREYRELIDCLLTEGKTTSGDPAEGQLENVKLNLQRMNRLDLLCEITDELKRAIARITRPQRWTVISEGWCGDAAQTVPMIAKAAALAPGRITLSIALRDQNPGLMDRFLTNGTRSIPILVVTDRATNEVLGSWGPRPEPARALVAEFKKDPAWDKSAMLTALHTWYAKDKTSSAQHELAELLNRLNE